MKKVDNILIGQTILFFLKEKKMKKGDLARALDIKAASVTHILKGMQSLSVSRLLYILEALDITPQKFFNRLEKEELHVIY